MDGTQAALDSLSQADFVLLAGDAVALSHVPGNAPRVVERAPEGGLDGFLSAASDMGVPLLEVEGVSPDLVRSLRPGEAVPEALYPVVADCLETVHRSPSTPRVLRVLGSARGRRDLPGPSLAEVAPLRLRVGEAVATRALEEALDSARHRLELELGVLLSPVEVEVDPHLRPRGYAVLIREVQAAAGELAAEGTLRPLLEELAREVRRRAWQLVGYRETEALLAALRRSHASLVDELFPNRVRVATLRTVLRNLLREGVPVRDLPAILEALLEGLPHARTPEALCEVARSAFAHYLCQKHSDEDGVLWTLVLRPEVEQAVSRASRRPSAGEVDLEDRLGLLSSVVAGLEKATARGVPAVVLTSPGVRPLVRRLLEGSFPDLPVLSYSEIVPLADVRTLALLGL